MKERFPTLAMETSDKYQCTVALSSYEQLLSNNDICEGNCAKGRQCPTGAGLHIFTIAASIHFIHHYYCPSYVSWTSFIHHAYSFDLLILLYFVVYVAYVNSYNTHSFTLNTRVHGIHNLFPDHFFVQATYD